MTYTKNQEQYLEDAEMKVYAAVLELRGQNRIANNVQIAKRTGMPASRVQRITRELYLRGYLRDHGRGTVYQWQPTGKPAMTEDMTDEQYRKATGTRVVRGQVRPEVT